MLPNETITEQCFLWCQEQYQIYQTNFQAELMTIPAIAIGLLIMNNILIRKQEHLEMNHDPDTVRKIIWATRELPTYILLGMLIFYVTTN